MFGDNGIFLFEMAIIFYVYQMVNFIIKRKKENLSEINR